MREQKIIQKGIHAADRLAQTRLQQVFQHFGWCARHNGISAGVEEEIEVAEYEANIIEIRARASANKIAIKFETSQARISFRFQLKF